MTDLPETLKAFTGAAAELLSKAINDVKADAKRNEEIRQFEHRAFMAETREALAALQRQADERLAAVKDGRDGVDGKDGANGENGKDGSDGLDGTNGTDGTNGSDGQDADMDALKAHLESLVAAIPVPENGKDGQDGIDGIDGADAYPGEARGLFDPEAEYRALDVVSFNGCEWRAKSDAPGELPGEGWMLSASKGKRGDRGEPGREGKAGETGASIIAAYADAAKLELILTRDDGVEVKADLYELAQTVRK